MRALMYHKLGEGRYGISEEKFKNHCDLLSGFDGPLKITFDDGDASILKAADILQEANLTSHFFIITEKVGQAGFVQSADVKELHERGFKIGSHGHSHRFFTELSKEELEKELSDSKNILEDIVGGEINDLSLPGGRFNESVLQIIKETKFEKLWSSEPGCQHSEKPLWRQGRDCVLHDMDKNELAALLAGRKDNLRRLRYQTLSLFKKILGDRLYHRLTARDD
jgi:peptidoglycan/xylan/chitin deacetylase (PgdA/CDA1 family)